MWNARHVIKTTFNNLQVLAAEVVTADGKENITHCATSFQNFIPLSCTLHAAVVVCVLRPGVVCPSL